MADEKESLREENELWRLKMLHIEINQSKLERAMRTKESKGSADMENHLFGWGSPKKWFEAEQFPR